MSINKQRLELRMMVIIAGPQEAKKAEVVLKNLPMQYLCYGDGTASNELMDILGIGSSRKAILVSVLPKVHIPKVYEVLSRELHIHQHGAGVAFTMPVSGVSMLAMEMCSGLMGEDEKESEVKQMSSNITHGLIVVAINQGYSDEVMAAAKEVGAMGGTVLHARRLGSEDLMKRWGISVQNEKELVMILVKKESKLEIMKAINEKCGVNSEAQGVIISLPVDSVIGLTE